MFRPPRLAARPRQPSLQADDLIRYGHQRCDRGGEQHRYCAEWPTGRLPSSRTGPVRLRAQR
ncbi:hypothetical protein CBOM_07727 [Ceraceosorus bombacis]|uniref:Uncharacterized protein n=1 Tax=Ceraceosorus bombacis TaxID=401625 RepID=A0A0P1BI31_9BASI|nr:hypothetical protein CBOM_07727 [Ceraceosorus bombacis]